MVSSMTNWTELLTAQTTIEPWFDAIASRLLNGVSLVVADQRYRLVEIEFYHTSTDHPDPFSHCDPLQLEMARWYFHRTRGSYRGGSFKGVDVTFSDGTYHGGALIRGIEGPDGKLIDGPSITVDHLLKMTGKTKVSDLDKAIGGRKFWDPENPLHLEWLDTPRESAIVRCGRVGLSLRKTPVTDLMTQFFLRRYRYLTEPRRTAKGKPSLVLALHAQGESPEAIHQLTGCPKASIVRYIADYESGRVAADFTPYHGGELNTGSLCKLHGTWQAVYGS